MTPPPPSRLRALAAGIALGLTAGCSCAHDVSVSKIDQDGDGIPNTQDCNDARDDIFPGAEEVCDGIDNDCDGEVDEELAVTLWPDTDGDGFGDPARPQTDCDLDPAYIDDNSDCDDDRSDVNPLAEEICDGIDNDCDSVVDEDLATLWYPDLDGDGHADPDMERAFCEPPGDGWREEADDCDDRDPLVHPGADEICDDGVDQDCDGEDGRCRVYGDVEIDTDVDVALVGLEANDQTGAVVALTSDVDGDGLVEILVGLPYATCGARDSGCATLTELDEGATGLISLADAAGVGFRTQRLVHAEPEGTFGAVVGDLGDLDGDGYGDFAVAAPYSDQHQIGGGSVEVFSGALVSGAILDAATMAVTITPNTRYDRLATTVVPAGDLSGDGYGDLIVATTGSTTSTNRNEGGAWIFHTCPEGVGGCLDVDLDGDIDITAEWGGALNQVRHSDALLAGEGSDDRAGIAAGGFDFNGDGSPDLALGAPGAEAEAGAVYLVLRYPFVASLAANAADLTMVGEDVGDEAGSAVLSAGDLDQDGYDDLVIGAPGRAGGAGAAYVVLGRDDVDLSILGSELSLADADVRVEGDHAGDGLGGALGVAGDLNNDTFAELMLGAPGADPNGVVDAGAVRILEGPPVSGAAMDVHAWLYGIEEGGAVGASVDGGEDLNADGYPDLVVGAPRFLENGRVFVIFGGFRP